MTKGPVQQPPEGDATLISGDSMIGEVVGIGRLGPGKRFDRYLVLGRLGAGERGIVYAAYDPDHDARVAIKLLRPRDPEALLDSAKRAAAVEHRNLVRVRECGNLHGIVFVIMDHVLGGERLREWLDAGPRPWPEALATLAKVGEGLAAAHRAGLVHRGFTPQNVLIDGDGEPRIVDLGLLEPGRPRESSLVRVAIARRSDDGSSDALAALLTPTDQKQGAWAYLAPEQFAGEPGDARADQFGFCVALYEALYGERPFEGRSIQAVLLAIKEARVRPPAARSKVPRWLRRIVVRGLAHDPGQRWPSMDALVDALQREHDERGRRIVASVAACVAVLAGATASLRSPAEASTASAPPAVCTPAEAEAAFAGAWSPDRRDALERRVGEVGRGWAEPFAASLLPRLDAWAVDWRAAWIDACAATRVRAEADPELLDRRMACLTRQRRQMADYADALLLAEPELVAEALAGVEAIDQLDACASNPAPLPEQAEGRAQVLEHAAALDRIRALELAGRWADAHPQIARARADASGWSPSEAELILLHARASLATHDDHRVGVFLSDDVAAQWLPEALGLALRRGDDRLAAEIAVELGLRTGEVPWFEVAGGLAERTGLAGLRDQVALVRASVAIGGAAALSAELSRLLDRLDAPPLLAEAEHLLAQASFAAGKYEAADAALDRARARWTQLGGDEHPRSIELLETAARFALARGRLRDAERLFAEAVDRRRAGARSDDPRIVAPLLGRATAQIRMGELERAETTLAEALALVASPTAPANEAMLAFAAQALFDADRGRLDDAARQVERALDRAGEYGVSDRAWSEALRARARVELLRGDLDAAQASLDAARRRAESPELFLDLHRVEAARGQLEAAEHSLRVAEFALLTDYGGSPDAWLLVVVALQRAEFCRRHPCPGGEVDILAIAQRELDALQDPDPALVATFTKLSKEDPP